MERTADPDVNRRIAERVRELRAAQGSSLDALAGQSGVSRSMISLIERGESSPTAVVLEKLAAGLGVTLASLFDAPAAAARTSAGPVARRRDQPQWQDPGSGYVRRNVSPPGVPQPMQIVEVEFPPGARVAFETGGREVREEQQGGGREGATGACTSRCGCSTAPSTSRWAPSATDCARGIAWRCSSTARPCSTTRREDRHATRW